MTDLEGAQWAWIDPKKILLCNFGISIILSISNS